jgi:segregation and condensation protein B
MANDSDQGLEHRQAELGLKALLESLIFISGEPVAHAELARALALAEADVVRLIEELAADYASRGIRLERYGDRVQFVSAPEAAPAVERLLRFEAGSTRLSNAALETLAVIAYRQPVTRPGIEAIRGVDVSGPLRTLQQRGLVMEVGRLAAVGRPLLYGTTGEFLRQFGLSSLDELPPLDFPGEDQASSAGQPVE